MASGPRAGRDAYTNDFAFIGRGTRLALVAARLPTSPASPLPILAHPSLITILGIITARRGSGGRARRSQTRRCRSASAATPKPSRPKAAADTTQDTAVGARRVRSRSRDVKARAHY
jgi:hypothetical protein